MKVLLLGSFSTSYVATIKQNGMSFGAYMRHSHLKLKNRQRKHIDFGLAINSIPPCISKRLVTIYGQCVLVVTTLALALKQGEDYYWIWIGTHDEYESLIG